MLRQESARCEGTARVLISLLLGFSFGALVILPYARSVREEAATTMASRPSSITQAMQPSSAWPPRAWQQPSRAGQFLQPLRPREPVQPAPALTSPDHPEHSAYPVAKAESNVQTSAGRRGIFAAAFALALAANDKAGVANAGTGEVKEGDVAAPPWALPVAALATILTSAVPVLLKPGEEALEQQREREKQVGVGFKNKRKR